MERNLKNKLSNGIQIEVNNFLGLKKISWSKLQLKPLI